jgi:hypothetical protein
MLDDGDLPPSLSYQFVYEVCGYGRMSILRLLKLAIGTLRYQPSRLAEDGAQHCARRKIVAAGRALSTKPPARAAALPLASEIAVQG